ncbi:MAG: peptidylprolyl isomerase [Bacteroidota bacterium]|jgi:peptidyl-prolyl cis-trans isomerase SurA
MNKPPSIFSIVVVCVMGMIPLPAFTQPVVLDRIVAVVANECVLLSDLNAQVEFYVFNNHVDPNTRGLQKQVLDAMINEKLILSKALEDTNITVTDDEVVNRLDALIARNVQQAGSEKKLEEIYGMPISKMKHEFRDETRKQIFAEKLDQLKFGDLQVSRREVEEFFVQYKDSLPRVPEELELYHIFKLPKPSDRAKSAVKAKAHAILDSIKAGSDFASFARRYSEDPGSAVAGGDLGFARRGQFVKEFEEAVFGLQENQLANLIETPFGIHIIQLLERRGESVHARHILFKIQQDSTMSARAIEFLKSLKDSIARGADFSDLAKRYSDDKETGPLGGLLGSLTVDQFDKSLIQTVQNLKAGDISDPVEVDYGTSKGYHIVYVKKRTPEHAMTLTGDWKRVEQLTLVYKRNTEYQKWIKQLRDEIFWETRL